jgi:hypothetical protein
MSWARNICAAAALTMASMAVSSIPAQAGVVVSSSGPSAGQFPVGRQIGSNEPVTLSDGDSITVLDNGGTRVFRGAGTFVLASQSGANRNRAFASLTTQRSATRARTGAVRDPSNTGEVRNPNLWYVDVAQSGTICLADPANVRLWRSDTQAQSTYAISREDTDEAPSSVTFPAGEMLAAWDAENPPVARASYLIGTGDGAVQVNFVFLEEVPEGAEAMAQSLIANSCMIQLGQMAQALAVR